MDLLKKLLPVVLVLTIIGGVFYWCLNEDNIKLEPEEIPLGLEWGMTEAEVISALESAGCYSGSDDLFYYGRGYQGIVGADYYLWFRLEEEGRLSSVTLYFNAKESSNSYAPIVTEEFLVELDNAIDKAYSKKCEAKYVHDDWAVSKFYLHKNVLVENTKTKDDKSIALAFKDRDAECNRAQINGIIEIGK